MYSTPRDKFSLLICVPCVHVSQTRQESVTVVVATPLGMAGAQLKTPIIRPHRQSFIIPLYGPASRGPSFSSSRTV